VTIPNCVATSVTVVSSAPLRAPIVGATKLHHLDDAIASVKLKLSPDEPHPSCGDCPLTGYRLSTGGNRIRTISRGASLDGRLFLGGTDVRIRFPPAKSQLLTRSRFKRPGRAGRLRPRKLDHDERPPRADLYVLRLGTQDAELDHEVPLPPHGAARACARCGRTRKSGRCGGCRRAPGHNRRFRRYAAA